MQFELSFLPAFFLTGIVYLFVAAGLLKNNIKQLYSRRTKREKFLTIGVVIAAVVMMLFVAGRLGTLAMMGSYSQTLSSALLWLLGGSEALFALALYLVCTLLVIIVSAGILDEIAQTQPILEVPYFFYVLLFVVEGLFYETTKTSVSGWFFLMLFSTTVYCEMKMKAEGRTKTKNGIELGMIAVMAGICFLERTIPVVLLIRYMMLMGCNGLLAICLNRSSVLKKKVWLFVIAFCYGIAFWVGRLI